MPEPARVTDSRSHVRDQIANCAEAIGKSKHRRKLFEAVYRGKRKTKTVAELVKSTGLSHKRVLDAGKKLADPGYIHQVKISGRIAYQKDSVLAHHKRRILSMAGDPAKLKKYPTKTNPVITARGVELIRLPKAAIKVSELTIDDIASFKKAWKIRAASVVPVPMKEASFKNGVKKILGEGGQHNDWGGETSDLPTNRLVLKTKRVRAVFALKGPGKKGKLTPKHMGKNADQVQRLFRMPADVFIVQYWDQVDESVVEQMRQFASAVSVKEGRRIYYGVIDGVDSARIIKAYPNAFK